MFDRQGHPQVGYSRVLTEFLVTHADKFDEIRARADRMFLNEGVTFNVYGDSAGAERIFPFDPMPRVIDAATWAHLEAGLIQRVRALNAFVADVYGEGMHPQGRRGAGRPDQDIIAVPPRRGGNQAAARRLHHGGGNRPGARRRRALLRAGGQCAHALGRLLRDQEPAGDDAPGPGTDPRDGSAQRRALSGRPAGQSVRTGALGRVAPDRRPADARSLQLGLFRARLPVPADGYRAGRRARPGLR